MARELCDYFEKGYASYYLVDYVPTVSAQIDADQIAQVFEFLQATADLAPKKKRAVNALNKADALTEELEGRIRLST
ncbi:MAG: hypothetical protein GF363_02715, partial [Chitinivibrionales bacterium]|nr:hypothetical protein [Chitinivibrionales bacterium]